jgi:hypothetical protein
MMLSASIARVKADKLPMTPHDQTICPECGAAQPGGLSCWERLGTILAWEYSDPDLQAEHFLTVASYSLQHPARFAAAAITGLRAALCDHLDHGLPVARILARTRAAYDGPQRVTKPAAERQPMLREWPMTVADVYANANPQGAAERVRAWAVSIRVAVG